MGEQAKNPMPSSVAKLPVWATVGASYRFVWRRPTFFSITLALPLAASVLSNLLITSEGLHALSAVFLIFTFLGVVQWHQAVILGREKSAWLEVRQYGLALRYMGRLFLAILLMIPVIVLLLWPMIDTGDDLSFVSFFAMTLVVSLYGRILISLPATAVGIKNFHFYDAWRATHGNTLRVFLSMMLVSLPFTILREGVAILPLSNSVMWTFDEFFTITGYFFEAVFLSLAYLHFRPQVEPSLPQA